MEEIKKENPQDNKKEVKLLTFQPQQMVDEIEKLKEEVSSLTIDYNCLNMLVTDLNLEIYRLNKKSLKKRLQELLLHILGGQWIEVKE